MNTKMIAIACAALTLAACERPVAEWTSSGIDLTSVKGLEDCRYIEVSTGGNILRIVRCPNSSTSNTYQSGKVTNTVTVDDAVEPERVTVNSTATGSDEAAGEEVAIIDGHVYRLVGGHIYRKEDK